MRDRVVILILFGVTFASSTETLIMAPILPQLARELGVAVDLGGVWVTAYVVATGTSALSFGPLSDRLGRKVVLGWGTATLAVGTLFCGVAGSFVTMVAARLVCGLGAGMLVTSTTSYVSDHFAREARAEVMTHVMNGSLLAMVLGIPAGAFLTASLGWSAMFFVLSALLVALFLLVLRLPTPREGATDPHGRSLERYRALASRRAVWGFTAMIGTNGVSMTMYSLYLSAWMAEAFGFATDERGLVYAIGGPAVLVGAPIAARLSNRVGRVPVVVLGTLLVAVAIAAIPLAPAFGTHLEIAGASLVGRVPWPSTVPLFALAFLVLLGGATRGGPLHTFALERVPGELRGTLSALGNASFQAGAALGSIVGGVLWGWGGDFRVIAWTAAPLNVAAAIALVLLTRGEETQVVGRDRS